MPEMVAVMKKEPKSLRDLTVTPISFPKVGSMGKTGDWRTFRPIIDESKCRRCLLCWVYCPEGCVERLEGDKIRIDLDYCKGCGICAHECPAKAIKMEREEK